MEKQCQLEIVKFDYDYEYYYEYEWLRDYYGYCYGFGETDSGDQAGIKCRYAPNGACEKCAKPDYEICPYEEEN